MTADTVLLNARVYTQDDKLPIAEAVAVEGGRIAAVGTASAIESFAGPATRLIDLARRTVAPGFQDSHMHVLPLGMYLGEADLSVEAGVRSVPELVQALRVWAQQHPGTAWVMGNRYNQNAYPGAAHPTRADLDGAFPDRPVYVSHTSAHAACASSVALRLAGVDRNTEDPAGGRIVRDASGEPTGVLLESAMELVESVIPRPSCSEMVASVRRAYRALLEHGVTAVSDMATGWYDLADEVGAYRAAGAEPGAVRVTLHPIAGALGWPDSVPSRDAFSRQADLNGAVRLGAMKVIADGAFTTRTAALREPFVDGSGSGMLLLDPDELRRLAQAGHRAGWQLATHAIGDRAIDEVLDAYESLSGAQDKRNRVEHAMLLDREQIARMKVLGVIPAMQPEFVARLGDGYAMGLGTERATRLNPYASALAAGLPVPFGSDCPVVPGAPLDGIRSAVHHRAPSGLEFAASERISGAEALGCYTRRAAWSVFDENETGTVTPGKRADLVVMSGDPTLDPDGAAVVATMVGGELVWGAEALE